MGWAYTRAGGPIRTDRKKGVGLDPSRWAYTWDYSKSWGWDLTRAWAYTRTDTVYLETCNEKISSRGLNCICRAKRCLRFPMAGFQKKFPISCLINSSSACTGNSLEMPILPRAHLSLTTAYISSENLRRLRVESRRIAGRFYTKSHNSGRTSVENGVS